ncbi:MAG TPA: hypothetical protein VF011_02690 [Terriglobales bacterium]
MRSLKSIVLLLLTSGVILAQAVKPIAAGTEIKVRMIDSLSSEFAKVGDLFHATLEQAVFENGKQVYPKGADVTGTVAAVHASGRLTDPGSLSLVLNTITSGNSATSINVQPLEIKGESHTKSNAEKIGGGAALGAALGGIFGGGKGAAIGAGAGGAAGTGAAAATGKKDAKVNSEAVLTFMASSESSAAPAVAATAETKPTEVKSASSSETSASESKADSESSERSDTSSSSFANAILFTARDRRVIRNCINEHAAEFPQGTLEREELPSGSERNVRVGGTLPRDLQAKAQSLPLSCEEQLPKLPNDQERVVYTGRVLLLDGYGRILDMFDLGESE